MPQPVLTEVLKHRVTEQREAARDGDGGHLVLVRLCVQARELRRAEPGGASLLRRLHARCNRRGRSDAGHNLARSRVCGDVSRAGCGLVGGKAGRSLQRCTQRSDLLLGGRARPLLRWLDGAAAHTGEPRSTLRELSSEQPIGSRGLGGSLRSGATRGEAADRRTCLALSQDIVHMVGLYDRRISEASCLPKEDGSSTFAAWLTPRLIGLSPDGWATRTERHGQAFEEDGTSRSAYLYLPEAPADLATGRSPLVVWFYPGNAGEYTRMGGSSSRWTYDGGAGSERKLECCRKTDMFGKCTHWATAGCQWGQDV